MRNVNQRTGLGSFLWTFCGVAGGTYLVKFQTWPAVGRYFCCLLPKHFLPPAPPSSLLPEQHLMVAFGGALCCWKPWPALSWTWSLMWYLGKSNQIFSLPGLHKNLYFHMAFFLNKISPVRLNSETTVDYVMELYGMVFFLSLTQFKKKPNASRMRWLCLKLSTTSGAFSSGEVFWFWFAVSGNLNKIMSTTLFPPLSSTTLEAKVQVLPSWFEELYRTSLSFKTLWKSKRKLR